MGGAQRIQSIKKATAYICGGFFDGLNPLSPPHQD